MKGFPASSPFHLCSVAHLSIYHKQSFQSFQSLWTIDGTQVTQAVNAALKSDWKYNILGVQKGGVFASVNTRKNTYCERRYMNRSQTCIVEARFSKLIKDIWMRIAVSSRKVTPYELLRNRGILKKKKLNLKAPLLRKHWAGYLNKF